MSSNTCDDALTKLKLDLRSCVHTDDEALFQASFDGLKVEARPSAVIKPQSGEQVGSVLAVANEFGVPVTTRGAGSSLTGGATPLLGGWVLDLTGLNEIEIDEGNLLVRCGPGAIVSDLQKKASAAGLFYPPDPSSKKFCTIGGNIACNAGGLRCVKYGVTRDYVLALSGYLATGEFVTWGRATRKFATGYNLRDLWIGSEGTLGVVTEAVLRLIPQPSNRRTFIAACPSEEVALTAPVTLIKMGLRPSIIEFLDQWTIDCLQKYTGKEIFPGLGANPVLLIELDSPGTTLEKESGLLEDWLSEVALQSSVAKSEEEAEEFWEVRRQGSSSMKKLADTKLNEDIVVPLDRQVELVSFVSSLREKSKLKIGVFGHCGDGNLHVNFMYNESDVEETKRAVGALRELMQKVVELGGAISGEHGVGLAKTPFVRMQFNDAEWRTMKSIKQAMDPKGILNPGKIFDVFNPWEQKKVSAPLPWERTEEDLP
jgi:glycolate oxidase